MSLTHKRSQKARSSLASFLKNLSWAALAGASFSLVGGLASSCSVPDVNFTEGRTRGPEGTCSDGATTQWETDKDCGGSECPARCNGGQLCFDDSDCATGLTCFEVDEGKKVCAKAHCFDEKKSADETDVDCGGGDCVACATGKRCSEGGDCESNVCTSNTCQAPTCEDGKTNGRETDDDCGGGTCKPCAAEKRCLANKDCTSGLCEEGRCKDVCEEGEAECDGDAATRCETVLASSAAHCGACNSPCRLDQVKTQQCSNNTCVVPLDGCTKPYGNCDQDDENGCETNLSKDAEHCGDCDTVCDDTNGTPSCENSRCKIACDTGWSNCNTTTEDGCEAWVGDDVKNCGTCGKVCTPAAGETPWCKEGACGSTLCEPNTGDCNGDGETCEFDLLTNANHCGACGQRCVVANGVGKCEAGACKLDTCAANFADCDGEYKNGCEVDLRSDESHCGTCDKTCELAGTKVVCEASKCAVTGCLPSFADCNEDTADGCEVDLRSNAENCSTCGKACEYDNAAGVCSGGSCSMGACATNYADCDKDPSNGCEVNLLTDPDHCGTCDTDCLDTNATDACVAGVCAPKCNSSFGTCDANPVNGCEQSLNTLAHCGGCAKACNLPNASESCVDMKCTVQSCSSGWDNCDNDDADGCEVELAKDLNHCGECGNKCSFPNAGASCTSGNCVMGACTAANFKNCDGLQSTGCEANINTDPDNCGGCDSSCSARARNVENPVCIAQKCAFNPQNAASKCTDGSANRDGNLDTNGCEFYLVYQKFDGNPTDNQLGFRVQICNYGATSVAIGNWKLRYWFSDETKRNFHPTYNVNATGGTAVISSTTGLSCPGKTCTDLIELTLSSQSVPAGTCSAEVGVLIQASPQPGRESETVNFNEANDYSFEAFKTLTGTPWGKIVLMNGSTVVLGTPPS
jgi:hypothetical protein